MPLDVFCIQLLWITVNNCITLTGWIGVPPYDKIQLTYSKIIRDESTTNIESSVSVDAMLQWKIFVKEKELKVLPDSLSQLPKVISSLKIQDKIFGLITTKSVCKSVFRGNQKKINLYHCQQQEKDAFMIYQVSYHIIMIIFIVYFWLLVRLLEHTWIQLHWHHLSAP